MVTAAKGLCPDNGGISVSVTLVCRSDEFHLAARRSIRRCRLGQGFHRSPALWTVVQRVLVLVIAFDILNDYMLVLGNVKVCAIDMSSCSSNGRREHKTVPGESVDLFKVRIIEALYTVWRIYCKKLQ